MPRVLVCARSFRQVRGDHWRALEDAHFEIVTPQQDLPLRGRELVELVGDVDALLVGMDEVTASVIESATRLKVVSKHGAGVDNIDVAAATRAGVVVTNTPGANQGAVAELTMGLILAALRQLPYHDGLVKSGGWSRRIGTELGGRTVGLVGLGRIGKEVALRLEGFRVSLIAHDTVPDESFASQHHIMFVPLKELLGRSDVVTLHAALTPQSRNLIGPDELACMKPNAYLINTARGGLVDEEALFAALKEGRLAGAALDVFADEPPTDSPLLQLGDKVLLTPHLGAQTTETVIRMGRAAAQCIVDVLAGRRPEGLVNPEVYDTGVQALR